MKVDCSFNDRLKLMEGGLWNVDEEKLEELYQSTEDELEGVTV